MEFVKKYGTEFIRVLTLTRNRGKGGAVRLVMKCFNHVYIVNVHKFKEQLHEHVFIPVIKTTFVLRPFSSVT